MLAKKIVVEAVYTPTSLFFIFIFIFFVPVCFFNFSFLFPSFLNCLLPLWEGRYTIPMPAIVTATTALVNSKATTILSRQTSRTATARLQLIQRALSASPLVRDTSGRASSTRDSRANKMTAQKKHKVAIVGSGNW